ncbi:putative serine protease F56F10.1 [Anoplophora glabripennis]|uniref:putative serine protease F56F10.1 n=1 Tax=Anoplophora glabripennis TaxID=217634 RepID=UPI000874DA98|nr:putative serine protease F56F10.1 [Anoplophora glabripennis]
MTMVFSVYQSTILILEYLHVVADVLASHSRECFEAAKKAFARLDKMIDSHAGARNVTILFNLCDDIRRFNTKLDVANFFRALAGVISNIVQYNTNDPKATSVADICDILTNKAYGDEINRLVRVTKLSYKSKCVNFKYRDTVNYARNVFVSPDSPARQWWYQTCTEFGWFHTTGQKEAVFGTRVPVDFHISLCEDVFGPQFNLNYMSGQIEKTNTHFGGRDINVRRVVFVQGSSDPWYPLGLTATTNPKSPVIFINGTSHCATMYGTSKNDLPQVTAAREEIDRLIGMWLGLKIRTQETLQNDATNSTLNVLLLVTCNFVIYKL